MNSNESEKRILTILDSTARTSNSVYMKKEYDKNKNGKKYFVMDKSKNGPQQANDKEYSFPEESFHIE